MTITKPLTEGRKPIIIGGGPAGLTAAYELLKYDLSPVVFEKMDKVGGISRTENYKGYFFDMGGHRFFTKSPEVTNFWFEILGDDFLKRPRLSRIFYEGKFFNYPLKPLNALKGLGVLQSIAVGLSYIRWQVFPYKEEKTFEQWVTNRFGKRLFLTFFKSYTEKVWGISTSELSAEWAAQRIKDLDLKSTILTMFVKPKTTITTLIEEFHYPKQGPGMLWTEVMHKLEDNNGEVRLNSTVCGFNREGNRITSIVVTREGKQETVTGTDFISSMPVTDFIKKLSPPPPKEVLEAADRLTYREFLTVCLIIKKKQLFDDNWIYIHDPNVIVGRIQNFKNWSPHMVPDHDYTSLGLEYFCNEGDELWCMPDDELVELGKREIQQIGLAEADDVIDGIVFRVEKSYPVYNSNYAEHLEVIRNYINSLENFQTIGRNGLHRYNNQDHAMLTGMYAVRNMLFDANINLWNVNADQEYHEEIKEGQVDELGRMLEELFAQAFMKLDPTAFGVSLGLVSGLILTFLAVFTFVNRITPVQDFLWLLSQYLPNYKPTIAGSPLGFLYATTIGFIAGWGFALLRNTVIRFYFSYITRKAEIQLLEKLGYFPDFQSRIHDED
jgi:protoporphyrinogen oxidase